MTVQEEYAVSRDSLAEDFVRKYHDFRETNKHIFLLSDEPGYKVWTEALYALAAERGLTGRFMRGQSLGYCGPLIEAGVDPDHLVALLVLCFSK
jgi:hypothetical protein